MPRPSFQFYPADWRSNAKLRRCTPAARGFWADILCTLHDSDEYGVVRYPLAELAAVAAVPKKFINELVAKGVLKGSDEGGVTYFHTPRHAGKAQNPVKLLESKTGEPCWYSSRMVRDEWRRQRSGGDTKFTAENQPERSPSRPPDGPPSGSPSRPHGGDLGDGSSSSSSSSEVTSTVVDKSTTGADGANVLQFSIPDKPDWWPKRDCYGRVLGEISDKLIYQVGRAVLGSNCGGLITRLKKCPTYKADWRAIVELLLRAHDEKADAKSWFMASLISAEEGEPKNPFHVVYPEQVYTER